MPSDFGSLNIALRALQSMQRAIEITSHNVANSASPSYSRQKAILTATEPSTVPAINRYSGAGQVGTGVTVEMISRFRSEFLDNQIRNETLVLNGWEVRRDVLQQIEVIVNEPSENGLNTQLSEFWAAWHNLASSPDNYSSRTQVVETASNLGATLRGTYQKLSDLQFELNDRIEMQVDDINQLAHRIANLNQTISEIASMGQQPNDLLDQRDQLLNELSSKINVDIHTADNQSVMVSLGGKLLVMDRVVAELRTEQDPTNSMLNRVVWADTGNVVNIMGIPLGGSLPETAADRLFGEMGATFIARDLILPEKMAQLDELAYALIGGVNALHQNGYGLDGESGAMITAQSTIPGTITGFSLVTPFSDHPGLPADNYSVEIRDNNNVLEFRLVNSEGVPVAIDDANLGDDSFTSDWQQLNLVAGTTFDTVRGLTIDFAPLGDHYLGAINGNADVTGFSLSGIPQAYSELPTDEYFVEVRDNGGEWQFRLVNSGGAPMQIYDEAAADGSLTADWQAMPGVPYAFDTLRGLTIQFSAGPYEEAVIGGSPPPPPLAAASVEYNARTVQVGTVGNGAANLSIGNFFAGYNARSIDVSSYISDDYNRIATATLPNSPGDSSIAKAIATLENSQIMNGNSSTIGDYYRASIAGLGQQARQAEVMSTNYDLLVDHLQTRQQEIAGVSLDEEATYLIQYQRAYQAAARVMTTIDEMLDKLINSTGIVGR